MFSLKGKINSSPGKYIWLSTPINLEGKIRNRLKVGKKYHSGRISSGVANGFASKPKLIGDITDKPANHEQVPRMTIGNMYRISLGHAGSP